MWIIAIVLAVLTYLAVRYQYRVALHTSALTIYAAELLLRPDLHQVNAAQLRDLIRREANDRSAERAAWRAIQQFAAQVAAQRGSSFRAILTDVRTQTPTARGA